jgi:stearoyl-CoA desaturase (Delta-9 desaturase)
MPHALYEFLTQGLIGVSWLSILVWLVVVTQLTIFAVTLYLHRSQAHRGVDLHPVVAHFFRFWAWLTTAMVTKEWVAVHRKHHAKCETEEDPHSPQIHGIGKVVIHGVQLYIDAKNDPAMLEKYGRGTPNDWIERKVYGRHSWMGPGLMLIIDFAAFGVLGIAVWAVQMLWIPVMAAGVVNGLGHWWGYRNFETSDRSTNLTPWGVLIGGEELHNNHHAFPSSARFALRRFEFDIGWAVLRGLEKLGLATILREAPALDIRPNVNLPDGETLKALLAHRFSVMTHYFKHVTRPTLRAELAHAGDSLRALPGRLRRALANDGRWLDGQTRENLVQWVRQRPTLATVIEFRTRLAAMLERGNASSDAMLESLRQWCHEAEQSGNEALSRFAQSLKGYALVPARR